VCKGNRLEVREVSIKLEGGGEEKELQSWLVAPHHKSSKWGRQPIICCLPHDLAYLYYFHILCGLPAMLEEHGQAPFPNNHQPYVFLWASTGKPVVPQQVSQLFSRLVLPKGCTLPPQKARAAFVTAMRDAKPYLGLDEQQAAAVMGHSIKMWHQVYDKKQSSRTAATVAQVLADWRHQVQQKHSLHTS
jgi:hypothetical protein